MDIYARVRGGRSDDAEQQRPLAVQAGEHRMLGLDQLGAKPSGTSTRSSNGRQLTGSTSSTGVRCQRAAPLMPWKLK